MNKNLKKVISSVAALTMVASSVAAFAVDFPDVESTASYAQAVQELSALDVISGYDDGTFGPDKLVTRAEITKMIVDALAERSSAEASTESTKFADVSADHWAKGYINQGVADGFIAGMSDTEFDPDANVTYVQAQKMLVSAIGYETFAQAQGGWPTGYKTYAASLDITKGISGIKDSTELTRAQVAQMIDNAMDTPLCVIASWKPEWNGTKTPNLEIRDGKEGRAYETLFTEKHDAYKVYGRVTETSKTGSVDNDKVTFQVEKADNFDDEEVKADSPVSEDMYIGDSKADNYLRTYSQALIQKNDDDEFTILSIAAAAANKSVTVASEDFDENKSTDEALYFFPAGTTKGSTKYQLDTTNGVTIYINGVESSKSIAELRDYLDKNETASVTLQKETEIGSTSTSAKYNTIMVSSYVTAIVDEVIDKTNETSVNFDTYSSGIQAKMTVNKDDDNYTYSFKLDGKEIEAKDLQQNDVLNIAYDTTGSFRESSFYDVIVTRNVVDGVKCTSRNDSKGEYTIGGTKYKAAEGMDIDVETSTEYSLYLDHFGRIAKADENSVSKNYGVLKNIYKKAAGDYMAQIITKKGTEEEYKVDSDKVNEYATYLKYATFYSDAKKENKIDTTTKDWQSKVVAFDGPEYSTSQPKSVAYPKQVVEYSVSSSSNKITIKSVYNDPTSAVDTEYKESGNKIGSVKMADSTVILDLSEVDTKDTYSVVSSLNDGSPYTAYGYDKSKSDNTYRFVIITKGTSSVFNSETQLAIFNGSEVIDKDGDKTAYNLVVNGEEKQFVLDDDVVITGNAGKTVAEDAFDEGDVLVYATNSEGYISRIYSVFAAQNVLNGSSFEDFRTNAFKKQSSVLADTKFADLLSDDDNDVNVVFGPVVDKSGSNITIGTVTTNAEGKYVVNYDEGLEVNYSNAKIYTYDFAARSDNSRVLLDEGIASTPDVKAAKTTVGGQDILNLEHEDVIDDVVFAVVRTTDKDEAQEIYLIVNND
ncbi:MAG: S-layer homology domain-containing protein [Hominilimicola sp.]|uniref:S-layer homology domain-containing protein n=1 Tax=Hominilimicola sp. TaxID=3073571 RepID=UPI003999EC25